MFPEERKEGSPRFGKLHFPVGLWINSPKKRLAKISRRWPSAGSVRSTSSDTTSRSSETPDPHPLHNPPTTTPTPPTMTPPHHPPKPKPPRHKRLSHLFHRHNPTPTTPPTLTHTVGGRWINEKKLINFINPINNPQNPSNSPQILKIFNGDLTRGANYKSVLATARSTAKELVKEALGRYGLSPGEGQFVLCDVVGRPLGPLGTWQVEYLREVGDKERPLVIQDVWKPKSGWSRRFEIRRKEEVEKIRDGDEEEEEEEEDDVTTQPHPLQKNRSRAASGGPNPVSPHPPLKDRATNLSLRRSVSDMNLSTKRRRQRRTILSLAGGEAPTPQNQGGDPEISPPAHGGGVEEEEGEGGASLELLSQCLIQPPQNQPYFLLLQGYGKEDFLLYLLTRPQHIFGRPERRGNPEKSPIIGGGRGVDTFLNAPDILPRHCCIQTTPGGVTGEGGDTENVPPFITTLRPFRGAHVTHNGTPIFRQTSLFPGDILGFGQYFYFLYKDPRVLEVGEGLNLKGGSPKPFWLPLPHSFSLGISGALGCSRCGRFSPQETLRNLLENPRPELRFRPEDEEVLIQEILGLPKTMEMGDGGGIGVLAPAFLLGLCLDHAARAFPPQRLPALLSRVALLLKETVWEKIKEIGDRQPENQQDVSPTTLSMEGVVADLRPLMLWLANAMELLNLAQNHVLELEKELELEGPCQELTGDLETCDEALGVLDEVIMSTFQQSVYYLTKTLYSALPALLDSNPFSGSGEPSAGQDLGSVPDGVRPTLAIYQAALEVTRDCHLHPDLVSQTFGYLFFFSNASLFNTLMEKGSAGPFFQWWRGVRVRTNLDLVLDWLTGQGLGDIAGEFFRKLSATANLLCTPRGCLCKLSWARLRGEYPVLAPAQLHHLLSRYQLGLGRAPPPAWSPPPEERDQVASGDIFESFSDHPPLLLPSRGFRLRPGEPVTDEGLLRPLCHLRRHLWHLEQGDLPANQRGGLLEGGGHP